MIEEKIQFIELNYISILYNLWLPLIFATLYVTLLPYLMLLFDKLSSKGLEGRKENLVQQNIFDILAKQRLAKEESILENIRASFRDKADLNKKIEILNDQIISQSETMEILEQRLADANEKQLQYQQIIKQDNDEEYSSREKYDLAEQYLKFKKSDIYEFFRTIGSSVSRRNSLPNNMDDLIVEKFKHSDIIKEVRDEENQSIHYEFTKKGKWFWKEFIMNIQIIKNKKEEEFDDLPF